MYEEKSEFSEAHLSVNIAPTSPFFFWTQGFQIYWVGRGGLVVIGIGLFSPRTAALAAAAGPPGAPRPALWTAAPMDDPLGPKWRRQLEAEAAPASARPPMQAPAVGCLIGSPNGIL